MKTESSSSPMKAEDELPLPSTPKKRKQDSAPSTPSSPRKKGWSFEEKYHFVLYLLASHGHKSLSAEHKLALSALTGRTEPAIRQFHHDVIKTDMQKIVREIDSLIDETT